MPIRIGRPPVPDMVVRKMPGAKVASVMHRGPYDELGRSWSQLEVWITEHGQDMVGPVFDIYHTDPAETPDPADCETELCWPIR